MSTTLPRLLLAGVLAAGAGTGVLSACSLPGSTHASSTTCAQFAAMSPDTGLDGSFDAQQDKTLTDLLREHHRATYQTDLAGLQVIAYCDIVDGRAESNQDSPIENIPGLQN